MQMLGHVNEGKDDKGNGKKGEMSTNKRCEEEISWVSKRRL